MKKGEGYKFEVYFTICSPEGNLKSQTTTMPVKSDANPEEIDKGARRSAQDWCNNKNESRGDKEGKFELTRVTGYRMIHPHTSQVFRAINSPPPS